MTSNTDPAPEPLAPKDDVFEFWFGPGGSDRDWGVDMDDLDYGDLDEVAHIHYLRDRGVSAYAACVRGYRSLWDGDDPDDFVIQPPGASKTIGFGKTYSVTRPDGTTARVLGVRDHIEQNATGAFLIPLFDASAAELTQTQTQIRLDTPRVDAAGKPLKFELPAGITRGNRPGDLPIDESPLGRKLLGDFWQDAPAILGEGPVKGDSIATAIAREGSRGARLMFGTGVTMFTFKPGTPENPSTEWEPVPAFKAWLTGPNPDKTLIVAFDADVMANPMVTMAVLRIIDVARRYGVKDIRVLLLPEFAGEKTGIDDALVAFAGGFGSKTPLYDLMNAHLVSGSRQSRLTGR